MLVFVFFELQHHHNFLSHFARMTVFWRGTLDSGQRLFILITLTAAYNGDLYCWPESERVNITYENSNKLVDLPTIRIIQGYWPSQCVLSSLIYFPNLNLTLYNLISWLVLCKDGRRYITLLSIVFTHDITYCHPR